MLSLYHLSCNLLIICFYYFHQFHSFTNWVIPIEFRVVVSQEHIVVNWWRFTFRGVRSLCASDVSAKLSYWWFPCPLWLARLSCFNCHKAQPWNHAANLLSSWNLLMAVPVLIERAALFHPDTHTHHTFLNFDLSCSMVKKKLSPLATHLCFSQVLHGFLHRFPPFSWCLVFLNISFALQRSLLTIISFSSSWAPPTPGTWALSLLAFACSATYCHPSCSLVGCLLFIYIRWFLILIWRTVSSSKVTEIYQNKLKLLKCKLCSCIILAIRQQKYWSK